MPLPKDKLGNTVKLNPGSWVQTERRAHQAWANLICRKPKAAMLLHHLVAQMGNQNAVVISQKTLARMMGIHERTVRRAIADLIHEKWIQVIKINVNGTASAYVVNDRVAWGQPREQLRLSVFSANVVADMDDQEIEALEETNLRKIPVLYPGERQLPDDSHDDPPSQMLMPGFEPDLPNLVNNSTVDLFEENLKIKEVPKIKKTT